jgi:hypothetical protein
LIKQDKKGVLVSHSTQNLLSFHNHQIGGKMKVKVATLDNQGAHNKSGMLLNNYLKQAKRVNQITKKPVMSAFYTNKSNINNTLPKINSFAYSATGAAKHSLHTAAL